jgi:hypothetical protein
MPLHGKSKYFIASFMSSVVLILVLTLSCTLEAQDTGKMEMRDTLFKMPSINHSLLQGFNTDFVLPLSLREPPEYVPMSLHQSMINLPASLSGQFQQQIDVLSPWKQELAKQNELRTLKTILGAVQAGGTAYLLYEHFRKYGLK